MPWRGEFGQYSGFLHAGLIGALIDTACGFAAVTVAGPGVLAAHFSQNCLRPAQGEQFIARARVVRAGKTQVFTACELFTVAAQERRAGRHRRSAAGLHQSIGPGLHPRAATATSARTLATAGNSQRYTRNHPADRERNASALGTKSAWNWNTAPCPESG